MQKENPVRAMSASTHTLEWQHLSTRTMELETSLSKPSWSQQTRRNKDQNSRQNNEDLGLRWRLLNHALHGGECSTCPKNLSSPQWVKFYSLHCTFGTKLLLIIFTMIKLIIFYTKSKLNVSMISISQTMLKYEIV